MNESLKKEAIKDIENSHNEIYPLSAVEKILLEYIDRATLAERKRVTSMIDEADVKAKCVYGDCEKDCSHVGMAKIALRQIKDAIEK